MTISSFSLFFFDPSILPSLPVFHKSAKTRFLFLKLLTSPTFSYKSIPFGFVHRILLSLTINVIFIILINNLELSVSLPLQWEPKTNHIPYKLERIERSMNLHIHSVFFRDYMFEYCSGKFLLWREECYRLV